ncbi:MAG TPA: 4'-phosphopantetheinyl transferase superfamily protein [Christiangramia sp.]|nr:4'-phosphopantetheinyl transferase superfamily protein [Christiangramia sp.]
MIGNDIIDLKVARAERKSENLRFIDKVFTHNEKTAICNALDPELHLWVLWSMKEAAYKAHQRIYNIPRKLNPGSYECSYSCQANSGIVKIGSNEYPIKIMIKSQYIHSTTYSGELIQNTYINGKSSTNELLSKFLTTLSIDKDEVELYKDPNAIPSICNKNSSKILPITVSHHGNFTAFAIPLINS